MKRRTQLQGLIILWVLGAHTPVCLAAEANGLGANLATHIDNAIEKSAGCLESVPVASSDELWYLGRAAQIANSSALRTEVKKLKSRSSNDWLTALIGGISPRAAPPQEGPAPWRELRGLMWDSVACGGGEEPSAELQVFITEEYEGYVLTHQILAMQWARSVGCNIPTSWEERERSLVARVVAELETDQSFGDLFAERLAVLGLTGRATLVQRHWVIVLLDAQDGAGCWQAPPTVTRMRYRGYTLVSIGAEISRTHTTSLAISAFADFRSFLGSSQE